MDELVPDGQGIALAMLYVLGNSFIFGLGRRAGADLWLAFLLAVAAALPILLLNIRLRRILPGTTLWEGLGNLVGKWPSRFIAMYYAFYAWRLSCLVTTDITRFISAVSLENTPSLILALMLVLLALWAVKAGIEVLARWSAVALKFMLPLIFITNLLVLTEVDLGTFLPFLYHGFEPVAMGALELLDFPLLSLVLVFWAFDSFKNEDSVTKIFVPGLLIGGFILMSIFCSALAVVGVDKYMGSYFPAYIAVSRINIARFLSRLEASVGIPFLVGSFLKLSVCLLVACKGLAWSLGFTDYRFLVTPLALGIIAGSQWFTKDLMELYVSATKMLHPLDVSAQVIIPVVLWIIAEIKKPARE